MRSLLALTLLLVFGGHLAAQTAAGPLRKRQPPRPQARSTEPLRHLTGQMISMLPQSVEVETESGNRVVCRFTIATQFSVQPDDFFPGDRIAVTTPSGSDDDCVATWVGKPEDRFRDPDVAERGAPSYREREPPVRLRRDPVVEQEEEPLHADPFIAKAMEANLDFSYDLPNYICRETMRRYWSRDLGKKWKADDVVEADVLLVEGGTEYRNITLDGRPTGAARLRDVGGTWSSGEYGAIVGNLFAPESKAKFTDPSEEELRGNRTIVYRYSIEQPESRWTLNINGKQYSPGHFGRVWMDPDTGRALRVETEASYIPASFPLITAEVAIEIGNIDIAGETYLLPIEAANMSCVRGSARCDRNEIEFTEHRKFTAASSVFTTESEIDFGGEAPEADPQSEPELSPEP